MSSSWERRRLKRTFQSEQQRPEVGKHHDMFKEGKLAGDKNREPGRGQVTVLEIILRHMVLTIRTVICH